MLIAGLRPGPLLFSQHADVIYELFSGLVISTAFLGVVGLWTTRIWARTISLPRPVLATSILVLCVVGSYATRSNVFDVWLALGFGAVGYPMERFHYSVPSFILGFVLGGIVETNLRRALLITHGSFGALLQSPVSIAFLVAALLSIAYAVVQRRRLLGRLEPGGPA